MASERPDRSGRPERPEAAPHSRISRRSRCRSGARRVRMPALAGALSLALLAAATADSAAQGVPGARPATRDSAAQPLPGTPAAPDSAAPPLPGMPLARDSAAQPLPGTPAARDSAAQGLPGMPDLQGFTGQVLPAIGAASDSAGSPLHARNAALHATKPKAVRGLYLNAWAAGSPRKLARLLNVADSTEINTFVIDVKEGGLVSYTSDVPLVHGIGADRPYIRHIRRVLADLKAHGVYPIARIVCFKDPVLARARPEWAIRRKNGSLWLDGDSVPWVDAYNRHVWDYNIAIAREALELGFAEIQWDYVRFPDVSSHLRATQAFADADGRSRADAIREFIVYSKEQLAPYGAPVTADVFGATVSADNDMGIGQKWERLVDVADVLLPMVYPSHFYRGDYDMQHPNAHPYRTVHTAMQYALSRSQVPHAAAIRPWLQDFTLGRPHYGAAQVRAQMQAVYDSGLEEWILWNPGSNYTVSALRPRGAEHAAAEKDKSPQTTGVPPTPPDTIRR